LHDWLNKKLSSDVSACDKKKTRCHPEPRRRRGTSQSKRRAPGDDCVIHGAV
jgi:hypothetical protein